MGAMTTKTVMIQVEEQTWDNFCELVRRVKADPELVECIGLSLHQVTRQLVHMVYTSDSLSSSWGDHVWDVLCDLVRIADPELTKEKFKDYENPPWTPEQEREHERQERKKAAALVGKRVRFGYGWPDQESYHLVVATGGYYDGNATVKIKLEGKDEEFSIGHLVVHPEDEKEGGSEAGGVIN